MNTNEPKGDYITLGASNSLDILVDGGLQSQDSFGRWMNHIMVDSPGSVVDTVIESSISSGHESFVSSAIDHHKSFVPEQIFSITDVSPAWAFSNEKTKVFLLLVLAIHFCDILFGFLDFSYPSYILQILWS